MKFNTLSPVLYTSDLQATISFYVDVLGFTCINYVKDRNWAMVNSGGAAIMLCLPNEHLSFDKPAFTGSFYINTSGVDEVWEKVKDKARICYPIENFDYGMREFAVYDNNDYLLQFGEEIATPAS
jgi:uncharacterized glyoxalase superfamily protein PhnB